ncbi:ribosomal protein S5 domain 2-like protein [Auriculariales sp. MPI-PUGE-AT-0066]|nr:ribosomal protein S5 domain 2-like protein [Auriculariales sp. MPI-PUGE-AT-0066]
MSKAESSYVRQALSASNPIRADGRGLGDYRTLSVVRGIIPLANGSARVAVGGTEVLASSKLEVTSSELGNIACNVICPGSAYPSLAPGALDDLAYDYTHILNSTMSDVSLLPANLTIIPKKKNWSLMLDIVVLCDSGNIFDVLFLAARIALLDTRVPRTSPIEYKAPKGAQIEAGMGFSMRREQVAQDFEIKDYWDEGAPLQGADGWPVAVTLNLIPPVHFLDALPVEETASGHRIIMIYSFSATSEPRLHGIRLLGAGEVTTSQLETLLQDGEKYARKLKESLDAHLKVQELSSEQVIPTIYTLR